MEIISERAKRDKDGSIVIDEGDGYQVMAYRFEHPTNNKSLFVKGMENQQISDIFGNPFTFVVICYDNGSYGYFADAGFFWKSMHRDWELVPVANWMNDYNIEMEKAEDTRKSPIIKALKKVADKKIDDTLPTSVNTFLKDYPEFRELFESG